MKIKHFFIGSLLLIGSKINAQWFPNGNPLLTLPNNYLGSTAGNNTWIKMGVNSSQDIFVDNNPNQLFPPNPFFPGNQLGGHWVGLGRIFTPSTGPGSFPLLSPKAHLHIHGGNQVLGAGAFGFSGGIRNWFNTGTLYSENSDAMYVGLRTLGSNQSYAVINWSDDAFGGIGTDYLSFNFTGGPNPLAGTVNGMELGRFSPTQFRGTLGVGNFQNIGAGADPTRRLEILDADPANGVNSNQPQLRTTYQYNSNPALGIYSEFQTTNLGDLFFNTRNSSLGGFSGRGFGFHKSNPLNTVEINSQPGVAGWAGGILTANGSSGLRFTNLTSAYTPQPNPGLGVLTVNSTGDVIYVPNAGIVAANNGVSVNSGTLQLGVPCSTTGGAPNLAGIFATSLTSDRVVFNGNQNFWFASINNQTGGVGVGGQPASTPFCNVGNTFEISANNKGKYGNTSASGLRLSKLTSTNTPLPNGGPNLITNTKVLSVDKDGDVVLVNAAGGSLGNICGGLANPLASNWEIPLNNKNFIFSELTAGTGKVGIGTMATACTPGNLLEVRKGTTSNVSGLRLTDLASASPGLSNGKVLSVNASGDVILVPDQTGGVFPNVQNALNTNIDTYNPSGKI